ncbi:hypothetical protein SO694_00001339 [Aureococcus anophagefferens]|uniref:Ubiquitin-like domain-containing protein n=1 Tax=Aureococcus anophagefferens TaxID=44056 RepID=A0ABR1GBY5_AURAN
MAKRHAVGRDGLARRTALPAVDRGDSPALYCFFSRQDTLGRATEAVAALLRVSPAAAALARRPAARRRPAASPSSPSPSPPPPPAGAYDLVVKYDKRDHTIAHLTPASTVAELKAAAAAATGVEPAAMKLIFKGDLARDDAKKLGDTALKPGAKILLMKTKPR